MGQPEFERVVEQGIALRKFSEPRGIARAVYRLELCGNGPPRTRPAGVKGGSERGLAGFP